MFAVNALWDIASLPVLTKHAPIVQMKHKHNLIAEVKEHQL